VCVISRYGDDALAGIENSRLAIDGGCQAALEHLHILVVLGVSVDGHLEHVRVFSAVISRLGPLGFVGAALGVVFEHAEDAAFTKVARLELMDRRRERGHGAACVPGLGSS
jgi:hypothetical protein